ncbi:6-phosphogluconolactonase [Paracoccus sp. p4-l81]|uniref:6-phosphogluconolactonase n=1 Tax=Paracoccus sp. p4-l81 TaxID=3342806 RepID=UPI0035B8F254
MSFQDYPDREFLELAVARAIAADLGAALRARGRATLALAGGTTPGPVFDILSAIELDWANVTVTVTDERCVPAHHDRSNARLLSERLLRGHARAARHLIWWQDGDTPDSAAARVSGELADHLPLDVVLLGMGTDAHTASLFPDAPELQAALASDAAPVMAIHPASQPEARLSLTAPVLKGALAAHLMMTGDDKRKVWEDTHGKPATEAPIQAFAGVLNVHWAA